MQWKLSEVSYRHTSFFMCRRCFSSIDWLACHKWVDSIEKKFVSFFHPHKNLHVVGNNFFCATKQIVSGERTYWFSYLHIKSELRVIKAELSEVVKWKVYGKTAEDEEKFPHICMIKFRARKKSFIGICNFSNECKLLIALKGILNRIENQRSIVWLDTKFNIVNPLPCSHISARMSDCEDLNCPLLDCRVDVGGVDCYCVRRKELKIRSGSMETSHEAF